MNHAVRMTRLRLFLRVLSVGYFAAFVPWITLILLNAPILAPGGVLAPLLRFQPYNAPYESMMTAIHLVWAVMLWRASGDPGRHSLFIEFTIWANAAHGLVMLIATPMRKGLFMTFVEGLPLFVIAAVLWWLRPRCSGLERPAAGTVGAAPTAARGRAAPDIRMASEKSGTSR